jgi:hypothetical protein
MFSQHWSILISDEVAQKVVWFSKYSFVIERLMVTVDVDRVNFTQRSYKV